jgi:hypothetical protein
MKQSGLRSSSIAHINTDKPVSIDSEDVSDMKKKELLGLEVEI